ncbi:hypothetical protein ACFYO2_49475 [Streptomyces sp. NPDC006602]|uniref:hypothetical protein n=1 Tax=Streptomyces sp. NPDC006602 TaxID=3364751 RepID=UPI0036CD10D4
MRAVIVHEYGQTPVLGEMPTPRPGPRQLPIRLRAAAVDRRLAHGDRRIMFPGTCPMVLVTDGAGIVESVGEGAPDVAAERMRRYGAAEIIDPTALAVPEAVQRAHPDGIDALIDLVSDADRFASPAKLVRPGGSAFGVPTPLGLIDHSRAGHPPRLASGGPRAGPRRRGHLRPGQAEIITVETRSPLCFDTFIAEGEQINA